jgi:hypothetical protein
MLKICIIVAVFLLAWSLTAISSTKSVASVELIAVENHHIIELNSDQPYVGAFHVNADDLSIRENVEATAVTVSILSTDLSSFPNGSWLAGGMFVQAQDSFYRNVDYAFYMMLVLDSSGSFYVDLGLHQTREETAPLHKPNEEVIYAYTWRASGIDYATPVTLAQKWTADGFVHYAISVPGGDFNLISVDVASKPYCDHIIRKFYAGNVVVEPFPISRYVNYFQFGVVSSESMQNTHWTVYLKEPEMLRPSGWSKVEKAWSIQGDIAYLDWSWKWGGSPYEGVDAQHCQSPLGCHGLIFAYNKQTLLPGRVLWDDTAQSQSGTVATPVANGAAILVYGLAVGLAIAIGVRVKPSKQMSTNFYISQEQLWRQSSSSVKSHSVRRIDRSNSS